jgi:hypothetical protein
MRASISCGVILIFLWYPAEMFIDFRQIAPADAGSAAAPGDFAKQCAV